MREKSRGTAARRTLGKSLGVLVSLALASPAIGAEGAGGADWIGAFIDDAAVTAHFRTFWFDRDKPSGASSEAWAAGGWIGYESGWFGGWLRVGAVGYTSQPVWAPDDKDGTLLLKPGQEGYSVLGQAYVALKFQDQVFTGYRQMVNQPEVNPQDNRMTPNTFQGYTLAGKVAGVEYLAGYLDQMKTRNEDNFRDFAAVAGAVRGGSEPMWLGGLRYSPMKDVDLRLSSYYVPNILGSTYADAAWLMPLGGDYKLRLSGQGMYQTSNGDDNLTGSSFDTWAVGIKGDLIRGPATLTLVYNQTGRGAAYRSSYGSWAGYTSMIINDFDRAGEKAWLIGGTYDFVGLGLPGFVINAAAVFGRDAIDPSTKAGLSNNDEYDLNVDYRFSAETWPAWARPFWIRGRFARLEEKQGGSTNVTTDYRVIVNYEWVFR